MGIKYFHFRGGAIAYTQAINQINTWVHMAFTRDNTTGTIRAYKNGVLDKTVTHNNYKNFIINF